jgi:hypothetical protein
MKGESSKNVDFLAGLIFIILGLVAAITAQKSYPIGTSLNMGPGYFPMALGYILTAFGLYVMVRGLVQGQEKVQGVWGIRPIVMVSLGLAVFGLVMDLLGLVAALFALIFISALGGREFKFKEVLILAVVLSVASWGLFIYALGMPLRLFVWGK